MNNTIYALYHFLCWLSIYLHMLADWLYYYQSSSILQLNFKNIIKVKYECIYKHIYTIHYSLWISQWRVSSKGNLYWSIFLWTITILNTFIFFLLFLRRLRSRKLFFSMGIYSFFSLIRRNFSNRPPLLHIHM